MSKRVIIIGAGAAGFFTAINLAKNHPEYDISILEKTSKTLGKVRISGGGRCNVTHACFKPSELVKFYPRGNKELLSPFKRFMTTDVIEWFEERKVTLKTEADGRMFPESNKSQTIVDCFEKEAQKRGINLVLGEGIKELNCNKGQWHITTNKDNIIECDAVVMTSGSNQVVWEMLKKLGHKIVAPVPSLFTFKISDARLQDIPGLSVQNAKINVQKSKLEGYGPLLITHWGLSGPAVLKLSAWGAIEFEKLNYNFTIRVNWVGQLGMEEIRKQLFAQKEKGSKQLVVNHPKFEMPKRLWQNLCKAAKVDATKTWLDLSKKDINRLYAQLTEGEYVVEGKSTFKDEFVTAGGVDLSEIDFKKFESKIFPNLFFAGEVLNIDAVTGGFNFQNAWTSSWIVSESM